MTRPYSVNTSGRRSRVSDGKLFGSILFSETWVSRIAICLSLLVSRCAIAQTGEEHNFLKFNPGIQLSKSLDDARWEARKQVKLVMLMPSNNRTIADSDAIGPSMETFRAGALVDARVVTLINRRFVPYYFEMDPLAVRYDKAAADILIRNISELRISATMPTPPLMIITPDGKCLGDISVYSTADELLESLTALVKESEELSRLNNTEKALDAVQQAAVLLELRQFDAALEIIENDQSSDAWFLRGAIAFERKNWADMTGAFRMVTDEKYSDKIEMYEIRRLWTIGDYDGIKKHCSALGQDFSFSDEAAYYAGLAHFHSDELAMALDVWEAGIKAASETPWGLRMDWIRGIAKDGLDKPMMVNHRPESILGRRFLSPRGAWDLKARQ